MQGKSILLIISGGIAAYKSLDLIRRLRERGALVRCIMTEGAHHFITPLSAATLSEQPVYSALFDLKSETEIGHIRLSREADVIVVAPATANLLAKMAQGLCDDLASTVLLAADKHVIAAPAMNWRMWEHPATSRNVAQLKQDGVEFVGPAEGAMACGEHGLGRMAEVEEIVGAIEDYFAKEPDAPSTQVALSANPYHALSLIDGEKAASAFEAYEKRQALSQTVLSRKRLNSNNLIDTRDLEPALQGLSILVTAGPTFEPLDPVRFVGNRSSGKQGYAIAEVAAGLGAHVTLITGPGALRHPPGVSVVSVETAFEMLNAVEAALPADVAIFSAAVADWRADHVGPQKLKKGKAAPKLKLVENQDILKTIATHATLRPKLVIGFAAETEHVVEHAKKKLEKKGCDWMVANDVSPEAGVFGGDDNKVYLLKGKRLESWPHMSKMEVAIKLMQAVAKHFDKLHPLAPGERV